MTPHIALLLALLAALAQTPPTAAADKLSVPTLSARLAEKPADEKARALADEVRTWFGKDRGGNPNVNNGSLPKVDGQETAWAIEAPGAKTAAVVVSDDKILSLVRIGDTPVFAGTFRFDHGTAFRWSYVRDPENNIQAGTSSVRPVVPWWSYVSQHARAERKSIPIRPNCPNGPACPRASSFNRRRGRARSSPIPNATGGFTYRLSTRMNSLLA
jgi:hypothetical protein